MNHMQKIFAETLLFNNKNKNIKIKIGFFEIHNKKC